MSGSPASVTQDDPRRPAGAGGPGPSAEALRPLDPESRRWLASLRATGPAREDAIGKLHALHLRAARFEVSRRSHTLPHLDRGELDDIALQSADDALVSVLAKLDQFRGNSRFTTWAYKFAVLEAAVKLRRRPWQDREITIEPDHWLRLGDAARSPHADFEQRELLAAVAAAIQTELTCHQREVLLSVTVDGVPIDVLAQRLGATRGALYKTIYDARIRLRRRLRADGFQIEPPAEDGVRR